MENQVVNNDGNSQVEANQVTSCTNGCDGVTGACSECPNVNGEQPIELSLLTFGEAIEAIKDGKKVKRKDWGGYWVGMTMSHQDWRVTDQPTLINDTIIEAHCKDGHIHPAQAYQEDMLAEDWQIVE